MPRLAFFIATLILALIGASAAAPQATPGPQPTITPELDRRALTGIEPGDAAAKAIGPISAGFADRKVDGPYFIGPQDEWTAKFFTKPVLTEPGLCSEWYLSVSLKRAQGSDGAISWTPLDARWVRLLRIVGPFEPTPQARPSAPQLKACADLAPFEIPPPNDGLLDAPSAQDAREGGLLLQTLVQAARSRAPLPFEMSPTSDPGLRGELAALTVRKLWRVDRCAAPAEGLECWALSVDPARPIVGGGSWTIHVTRSSADPHKIAGIDMGIYREPSI